MGETMSDKYCGMSLQRWDELMNSNGPCVHLTEGEMADGWHWCPEWDDLLIHPMDGEYQFCQCEDKQKYKRDSKYYEELRQYSEWIDNNGKGRDYPDDFGIFRKE
jgi:hypothetical protein